MSWAWAVITGLCLMLACSCGGALDSTVKVANVASQVGWTAQAAIEDAYGLQLDKALAASSSPQEYQQKSADIELRFSKVKDVYYAYRLSVVALHKALLVARRLEESGGEPDLALLIKLSKDVVQAQADLIAAAKDAGIGGLE